MAAAIRRRIDEATWRPGEKIPPLPVLQDEFAVARVTIRQAVEMLEGEGLLRRVQGAGTFVAASLPDKRFLKLDLDWSRIPSEIGASVPHFLSIEHDVVPPERVLRGLVPAGAYRFFESRQAREGAPFSYARAYVVEDVAARAPERFAREPALYVIATLPELAIGSARQSFVIGAADEAIAGHLMTGIGSPTAEAHITIADPDGRLLYVADVVYRGDCVRLDVDLLR
ncbi:GntR family transcriptional regulator [Acuticoccus sediminis]|uniref:GntR family transcriptional regulator n=1 Tax=Acuticoccus sediminis TaxID=2184697 RepID=UPI00192E3206|nr:GntR family transcriptional regulator [Acuticoccus sediminis]